MKKLLNVFIGVVLIGFSAFGQEKEPPSAVKEAFNQKVPNAKDVEWNFDSEDMLWEVAYKLVDDEFEAAFDEHGNWTETEKPMQLSALPESVQLRLKTDYSNYKADEAEFVETPEASYYEIEVTSVTDQKVVELHITPAGDVLQMEDESQDDENDDENDD